MNGEFALNFLRGRRGRGDGGGGGGGRHAGCGARRRCGRRSRRREGATLHVIKVRAPHEQTDASEPQSRPRCGRSGELLGPRACRPRAMLLAHRVRWHMWWRSG